MERKKLEGVFVPKEIMLWLFRYFGMVEGASASCMANSPDVAELLFQETNGLAEKFYELADSTESGEKF